MCLFVLFGNFTHAQWTKKTDALRKRAECPSVLYKGKIYVFGGFGEHPNFENDNEVYDPSTDTWTLIASFPNGKAISHQEVVVVDDKIWHIGGRAVNADGPVSSQVIIYDITSNTWFDGPSLPVALGAGGSALIGRTLHYFGGFGPTICADQISYHFTLDVDKWISNPLTTTWENKLTPMPLPRNHLNTIVFGGKIYALGGQFRHDCSGADQKYCHVYDPITDTWTRLTDLPLPRSHSEASSFALDGKLYVMGGQGTSNAAQKTAYIFNPEDNNGLGSWSNNLEYQLPDSMYGISAKVVGDTFIISHGALINVVNERRETYIMHIERNIPHKLGFTATCFSKTLNPNQKVILNNLLYTFEEETSYSLTSNAPWLTITKNGSGIVGTTATDIEFTIDANGLAPGNYSGIITATGTGEHSFEGTTFCVNLTIPTPGLSLDIAINGNGSVTKNPDFSSYTQGTNVLLTAVPAPGQNFAGWSGDTTSSANPITIRINTNKALTANFVASPSIVSSIVSTSGRTYSLGELVVGNTIYTDRTYVVTSVADSLLHLSMIKTPNDDKLSKVASIVSFDISKKATVYIAYDPRATALPAWLSTWQKLIGQKIGINDPKITYMQLYSKSFVAGKITLGGNLQSPAAGALNNYFVIIKPAAAPVQYTLNVSINGNGTVAKTLDQASYNSDSSVVLTATPAAGYQFAGWSGDVAGTTNPLTITINSNTNITATFTPIPAFSVSNIVSTSGRNYVLGTLTVGTTLYSDRTYLATSVPSSLLNAPFIKTPNDDKANKSASLLSFDINQSATIYIAYDPRGTALPAWMSGWQKISGQVIGINDPKISTMQLYNKTFAAGKVTLGGNLQSPAMGTQNNYIVIIQPQVVSPRAANTSFLNQSNAGGNNSFAISTFKIYPNPNSGKKITIEANSFVKNEVVTISVFNSLGEMVKSIKATTNNEGFLNREIFFNQHLTKGIYLVNVASVSHRVQKKTVIN